MFDATRFIKSIWLQLEYILDHFGDWIYFIIRIYLFAAFFYSGYTKIVDMSTTLMLFEYEYSVPLLNSTFAAYLGAFTELIIPWFILFGMFTRFTSLILFVFNAVALYSYPFLWTDNGVAGFYQHFCWGISFAVLMSYGAKRISVDYFLFKSKG